jgi:hypothetical protein
VWAQKLLPSSDGKANRDGLHSSAITCTTGGPRYFTIAWMTAFSNSGRISRIGV